MSLLQLAIIAIIQGITEWLPISSSGHVLLASNIFGLEGRDELLINAVSNLGTLAAMLIYFRKDVAAATLGGFELLLAPFNKAELSAGGRLALLILAALPITLIVMVVYIAAIPEAVRDELRNPWMVASTTIGFGLLLWWADTRTSRDRLVSEMSISDATWIGASAAIAAIAPGTSRSGITMTVARAMGYGRTEAARFSMLIGAPILAAAAAYGLIGLMDPPEGDTLVTLQDGLIVAAIAFVSGLASIWALMAILARMSFLPFVIYRLLLGVALIVAAPTFGLTV